MRIFKWTLAAADRQTLMLPVQAELLSIQTQDGAPQMWALVDECAARELRTFATYGTGNPMPDDPGTYVGTYQLRGGAMVFHVFETPSEPSPT
jgi:hypothetical protein